MKPKDKANELVDIFRIILMNEDTDCGNEILCTMIAIKHAIICVNEILRVGSEIYDFNSCHYKGFSSRGKYYRRVKQELKKF